MKFGLFIDRREAQPRGSTPLRLHASIPRAEGAFAPPRLHASTPLAGVARAGFTLVELLVVIVIIGILIASFAFSTHSARENARTVKATAEGRQLADAIRLYCLTNLDSSDSDGDDGGNPMGTLGLNEGINEAKGTLVSKLTDPSANDAKTIYFEANYPTLRGNTLYDPWGHPYRIRVKKAVTDAEDNEDDYVILVPAVGRRRELKQ